MTAKIVQLEKLWGLIFGDGRRRCCFCSLHSTLHMFSTPRPEQKENETVKDMRKRNKWDNNDFICGHILNGMIDSLFDVYQHLESAKELWNDLEGKYMVKDTISKKFLIFQI